MRRKIGLFSLAVAAGALFDAPLAEAGPNPAYCMAMAQTYNNCLRDNQRTGGRGGYDRHGYDDEGRGGYSGGYAGEESYGYGGGRRGGGYRGGGYDGGYRGGYGGGGYGHDRRQRRAANAQAACAPWLMQMKASGCF